MFRTVLLSIIRSYLLYTQQTCMIYTVAVFTVTPNDGQRNCPKHVDLHSKNKFEKLVHLYGFIIRNQHSEVCTATTSLLFMLANADFDGLVVLGLCWVSDGKNSEEERREEHNEKLGLFLGYLSFT